MALATSQHPGDLMCSPWLHLIEALITAVIIMTIADIALPNMMAAIGVPLYETKDRAGETLVEAARALLGRISALNGLLVSLFA